ncbi:hypothetical protein PQX77_017619 [Marasmius sp. AFHP31]|nr:hypothetical protein PQX77_017619 [Marasmius sp. AFHP31]
MSGLPLLSGPPPPQGDESGDNDPACRKCNKEFNFLFTRSRKCNHCGFMYCHNCTDYQALMPRSGGHGDSGYDLVNVCAFCIEFLQITAAGRGQLKSLPLSKLKKYAGVYNIPISRAVEKDDIINALLSARRPNGCLPSGNEAYYRNYSVPNRSNARPRGLFSSRPEPPPNPPPRPPTVNTGAPRREFARPDLEPDPEPPRPAPNYQTRPSTNPNSPPRNPTNYNPHYTQSPPPPPPPRNYDTNNYHPHYTQYQQQSPPPPPPHHTYPQYTPRSRQQPPPTPPRPAPASRPAPAPVPPPPPPPPPSLDELLDMSEQAISSLPISSLKQVLFQNHVSASGTAILEKTDLVKRVIQLAQDERWEREEREEREREEREEEERAIREAREEREREAFERQQREEAERRAREMPEPSSRSTNPNHRARVEDASDDDDSMHHPPSQPPSQPPSPPQEEINILPPRSPSPSPSVEKPQVPPPSSSPSSNSHMKPPTKSHERNSGLCVICQDEDANIAIVDCGHMAMCRPGL